MAPHIENDLACAPRSWVLAALFAITAGAAHAATQVDHYRPVFEACTKTGAAPLLAIRRMGIDGQATMLAVDPATLATHLEPEADWTCTNTDDEHQKNTRYLRAIQAAIGAPTSAVIVNGGIQRGPRTGAFITGDLCPSLRPFDRAFVETLYATQSPLPLALAISGTWLLRHRADFQWIRTQEQSGALQVTWVDHSYDHPYVPGRPFAANFLLSPGVDMQAEILRTERILIANGETPSVFFRFPGLISNTTVMHAVADDHLIVLGAGAWLAQSPRARPGDIILIHLNGRRAKPRSK